MAVVGAVARPAPPPPAPPVPPSAPPAAEPAPVLPVAAPAAGFWIRVVAALIDGVVLWLAQKALTLLGALIIVGPGERAIVALAVAGWLFQLVIGTLYEIVFVWRWGQTVGKMAVKIRVMSEDYTPVSLGQSVGRYFAKILSALVLLIGYLMVAFRADKRGLHDLLAGTRVVHVL